MVKKNGSLSHKGPRDRMNDVLLIGSKHISRRAVDSFILWALIRAESGPNQIVKANCPPECINKEQWKLLALS